MGGLWQLMSLMAMTAFWCWAWLCLYLAALSKRAWANAECCCCWCLYVAINVLCFPLFQPLLSSASPKQREYPRLPRACKASRPSKATKDKPKFQVLAAFESLMKVPLKFCLSRLSHLLVFFFKDVLEWMKFPLNGLCWDCLLTILYHSSQVLKLCSFVCVYCILFCRF